MCRVVRRSCCISITSEDLHKATMIVLVEHTKVIDTTIDNLTIEGFLYLT